MLKRGSLVLVKPPKLFALRPEAPRLRVGVRVVPISVH